MDTGPNRTSLVPPPDGITPDLDNPRDAGWTLSVVGISTCTALVTIFFGIRCYVKIVINRHIILSDWTCLVAWVLILLYAMSMFVMTRYGLGYHVWEISQFEYSETLKWLYASSVIYIPAAYFTKVTLLLLIARVFAISRTVASGIHALCWILLVAYTPIQILKILVCVPISAYWNPMQPDARCFNQRKLFVSDLTLAVVADFLILLLSIVLTWSLRLPLKKKIKIILLLGAGGIAIGVTLFRMIEVVAFLDATDVTSDFVILGLTTAVELTIGLVCACLPSLNQLYERCASRHRTRKEEKRAREACQLPGSIDAPARARNNRFSRWRGSFTAPYRRISMGLSTTKRTTRAETETETENTGRVERRESGFLGVCDLTAPRMAMTFERELALFTGRVVPGTDPRLDGEGRGRSTEVSSRPNSTDGRNEGWLAPKSDSEDTTNGNESDRAVRSWLDVRDLERGPDVGYWSTIWDGSRDDIPR